MMENVEPEMEIREAIDRRAALLGGIAVALLLAAAFAPPHVLGDRVAAALSGLGAADPRWLWLGGACFLGVLAASGCAWRCALRRCGGNEIGVGDATARYGAGSLVNALAPAGAGGAVRIALFSRTLPVDERIWVAAGVAGVIGLARGPVLALLVLAAAATGALPAWPVAVLAAALPVGAFVAWLARRWRPHVRVAHVLDVFRALGGCPRAAAAIVGWIGLATACRVAAAAAVLAALGVEDPARAALVMIPAVALAGLFPVTPGNVGVGSGAAAVALALTGVGFPAALSAGIAFQALETMVSLLAGTAGIAYLARPPAPAWWLRAAAPAACLCVAGALGATLLVQLS
jgi:uncharacterized membrane protein YbhN (UPF0104 family)